ncbi:MAG: DUF4147 domain-containing protein [Eisenbergiella massiliensis]
MREDAFQIIQKTIADCLPDKAVRDSLQKLDFTGKVYVVAIGKAAWVMAKTASVFLADRLEKGIIITKYEHSRGALDKFEIIEAGHPTPDENSVLGAGKAVELVKEATQEDTVLLLLSGGGSSLVELPMPGLTLADIQEVTRQRFLRRRDYGNQRAAQKAVRHEGRQVRQIPEKGKGIFYHPFRYHRG